MTRTLGRMLVLAAACLSAAVWAPTSAAAQGSESPAAGHPTISGVAAQLGVKVSPSDNDDLQIGTSFTGLLDDPAKLAEFGIANMHAGARVTVTRVAPEKVRIEADEVEPAPLRGSAALKLSARGELSKAPKS